MWDSRVMKHGLRLGFNGQFDDFDDFDDKGRPVLITAAAPSYEVEHRTRVRKYLTLDGIPGPRAHSGRHRLRRLAQRTDLATDRGSLGAVAMDGRSDR